MKELSIEEKAKRYDEVLEKARRYYDEYKTRDNILYVEDMEDIFSELKEYGDDEQIRKAIVNHLLELSKSRVNLMTKATYENWITWLKKQGERPNKVSIWKHWKNGIAGNGDGVPTYLIKIGTTYSLSSCLGFECDYIELSELEKLMVEKQCEQKQNPCEDCNHVMLNCGNFPCEEKKGYNGEQKLADKVEPKFKVGDIISNGISEVKIVSIDKDNYSVTNSEIENDAHVCNWVVYFKDQDNWELVEQKPTDKVEPKIYIEKGQWYVCIQSFTLNGNIVVAKGQTYKSQEDNTISGEDARLFIDKHDEDASKYFRPWTIQDAKDGDVLVAKIDKEPNDFIYIFKAHDQNGFSSYCYLDAYINKFHEGMYHNTHNVGVPATKEQRDLLFQKMKEAGYEWDAENKVLEKIEQTPAAYFYCKYGGTIPKCSGCIRNHLNSKYKTEEIKTWMTPASRGTKQCSDYIPKDSVKWSVEDEVGLGDALWAIEQARTVAKDENDMGNLWYAERWLRALKERLHPQPKQELSEDASTNEYIDLGLPSGTLWKLTNEDGYYTHDEAVEKFNNQPSSKEQWEELKDKCKWEWKDNGYEVTGPNGNMIFLPADGYRYGTEVLSVNTYGNYWSCTSDDEYSTWYMCFDSGGVDMYSTFHSPGFSVRLVK